MAFCLEQTETLSEGLRRAALEQIADATRAFVAVGRDGKSFDDAVHDARRALKRVRTVLRLIRSGTSARRFRRCYNAVRDAGRMLGGFRDAAVVRMVVADLVEGGALTGDESRMLAERCAERAFSAGGDVSLSPEAAGALMGDLATLLTPTLFEDVDPPVVRDGIFRLWKKARQTMPDPAASPAEFHEWRKAVKFARHQVELLAPAFPQVFDPLAGELRKLTRLLGRHHDLAVARHCLLQVKDECPDLAESARRTGVQVEGMMRGLAESALSLGRRLFALRPRAYSRWMIACWKTWRESPGEANRSS